MRKANPYQAWLLLTTCMLLMAVVFTAGITLPSMFVKPVAEALQVGRTPVTANMTITTVFAMLTAAFAGRYLTHGKIRRTMLVCITLDAAAFIGYSLFHKIQLFYMTSAVVGFCTTMLCTVPVPMLINNWFAKRIRGRVMAVAMTGSGLGAMALHPAVGYINEYWGWRYSYRLLGVVMLLVLLPAIVFTVYDFPAARGLNKAGADGEDAQAPEIARETEQVSVRALLRGRTFQTVFFVCVLYGLTTSLYNVNAVAYFTDSGLTQLQAAGLLSLSSASGIAGKLLLGAVSDRAGVKKGVDAGAAALLPGTCCMLAVGISTGFAFPSAILLGMGNALPTVGAPLLIAYLFGGVAFGTLNGIGQTAISMGVAAGSVLGSAVFDATGSYTAAWVLNVFLIMVAWILTRLPSVHAKIEG